MFHALKNKGWYEAFTKPVTSWKTFTKNSFLSPKHTAVVKLSYD